MDEHLDAAGTGPAGGGPGDHGDSVTDQTPGRGAAGDGSGPAGRYRSSGAARVRWIGVAAAAATIALVLAEIAHGVSGNSDTTGRIRDQLQRTVPGTVHGLQRLQDAVDGLQDAVGDIPTDAPTPIVTVVPGPPGTPGRPGRPGQVVTTPPRTVVITTPAPAQPGATPTPRCRTAVVGICLAP